jgi:glycosyltransferase involved in cell wall biosynthesis
MKPLSSRYFVGGLRRLYRLAPHPLKALIFRMLSAIQLRRLAAARKRFQMRSQTSRHPGLKRPPHGVNLIADPRSPMSGGVIARGLAGALGSAEIPFDIINLVPGFDAKYEDTSLVHKEVRRSRYDISVVCANPEGFAHLRILLPMEMLTECYVILYSFWELPEFPAEWMDVFGSINEYWAGSRFIQKTVELKSPVPVVLIPPVVQPSSERHFSREELSLPTSRFLFLTMADTLSVLERKNPLGVVRAFKKAFSGKDSSVGLVIKLNNPDHLTSPSWQNILDEISECENVYLLRRVLTGDEVTSLISQSDCYVSLHRSEGFGLVPAEAMSLGKPTILTNWSGNTDYMTKDNSIGIDYELVKVGQDYGPYKKDQYWAEPDIDQAAYWMKRIYQEPELARSIGLRGKDTISSEYSTVAISKLIQQRLEYIRRDA